MLKTKMSANNICQYQCSSPADYLGESASPSCHPKICPESFTGECRM